MKIIRTAAFIALGKRIYDEMRKPENQKRIKSAMDSAKRKRSGSTSATAWSDSDSMPRPTPSSMAATTPPTTPPTTPSTSKPTI